MTDARIADPSAAPPALSTGHGTANDFVFLYDPAGEQDLNAEQVALLCNRRTGIGADGLIRVVRTTAAGVPEAAAAAEAGAEWFMDYRNADGSIAEMCGNGVRAFAHYLRSYALAADPAHMPVGTRAGVKTVTVEPDPTGRSALWYRVDMGQWTLPGNSADGGDTLVLTRGVEVPRPGLDVDMGNPHTVVALASAQELTAAELTHAPQLNPNPPAGTNVEYIVIEPDGDGDPMTGSLRMRVFERGVGETQACGTGACAAALAAHHWAGSQGPISWLVEQPGGTVRVDISGHEVSLAGPAELTAVIELSEELKARMRALL
ncbi:diaminopimelate epimerase [Brevibacterium otitidis]|uniref:Diaminopimelate epimerase n=1 Tax=Brevibacterium otitidis TaxID=53364 RepID=A0ABV5WZL3_9MICO|nr:diaminopimelate epimerase [Brevibacterium otitidis]